METDCVICQESVSESDCVILGEKGTAGCQKAATERKDNLTFKEGQKVHKTCRNKYTKPSNIQKAVAGHSAQSQDVPPAKRRSSQKIFSFQSDCFFCGTLIHEKTETGKFSVAETLPLKKNVLAACNDRKDDWSEVVQRRILSVSDLPAADGRYHRCCFQAFKNNRNIPLAYREDVSQKKSTPGRPVDKRLHEAFLQVANYLKKNDDEQITITDLISKMDSLLANDGLEGYSYKHMKEKLKEHFGDELIFTDLAGKSNVVTFRYKASQILHNFYKEHEKKKDQEQEKRLIIETAAKLILTDIKDKDFDLSVYPETKDFESIEKCQDFIPQSLQLFLDVLSKSKSGKLKRIAIGHALQQLARPRILLAPLQVALGVQAHHLYGSRLLVDLLYSLGFSTSYDEVQKFERNAAVCSGTIIRDFQGKLIGYGGDNADYIVRTLDGHNTLHVFGQIGMVSPEADVQTVIPRGKVTTRQIAEVSNIPYKPYDKEIPKITSMTFEKVNNPEFHITNYHLNLLWKTSILFGEPRPSWSGFQQLVQKGSSPGKCSMIYFPFINDSASKPGTLHTALHHFANHSDKHYQPNKCSATYDQPLYQKVLDMLENEPDSSPIKNVVPRLGGLHSIMSFLGSIGHIMAGSGISEILSIIYAENTVDHMLSGKALARSLRGHITLASNVYGLLLKEILCDMTTAHDGGSEITEASQHVMEPDSSSEVDGELPENANDQVTLSPTDPPLHTLPIPGETADHPHDSSPFFLSSSSTTIGPSSNHPPSDLPGPSFELPSGNPLEPEVSSDLIFNLKVTFKDVEQGQLDIDQLDSNESLIEIAKLLDEKKKSMTSPTAKLWLQYLEMVDITLQYITAERTGNWDLHLETLSQMLPYYAASGHNLYLKSGLLYLQKMHKLPETHPELHQHFLEGSHVFRESERFWCGQSSDLAIEKGLMRDMKSIGGLTHGRGVTENVSATWLLSLPHCASYNKAMLQLTDVDHSTSEQNKDLGQARMTRDWDDTQKIANFLEQINPFNCGEN
jgi:hypothetical protein